MKTITRNGRTIQAKLGFDEIMKIAGALKRPLVLAATQPITVAEMCLVLLHTLRGADGLPLRTEDIPR